MPIPLAFYAPGVHVCVNATASSNAKAFIAFALAADGRVMLLGCGGRPERPCLLLQNPKKTGGITPLFGSLVFFSCFPLRTEVTN